MMKNFIHSIRKVMTPLGLVERAQVVASTAVLVAMGTIIGIYLATGERFRPLDFMSAMTVGVIGYISIFFLLKYGRILDEQRRELLELNTITEAVNSSVQLESVLHAALVKVVELLHADAGWIYLEENNLLMLRDINGTEAEIFPQQVSIDDETMSWIRSPGLFKTDDPNIVQSTTMEFANQGVKMIASIPLVRRHAFSGVLIIGYREPRKYEAKKIVMIQAFGNQISAALNNASLFEQVRESEQVYLDLYEYSPDMYHAIDKNGIVLSCNITESRLLGYSKEDIVGKPVIKLYPPAQHHRVKENMRKIFEEGQELRGIEEQMLCHDGTLLDVSVNTSLIRSLDGSPWAVRMVLRDITEKKKMEEKILQAQKIDSIGNLAGGIAHDFNNILTAILGSASIMRRRIKNDQGCLKYVDLIEMTSRRGASVTRQLLTFARKSNPHVDRIDVNSIIEQTLRLFEITAPKSIHLKCVLSPEPVLVEADESQLQQALLNLCINTRDAMPQGGVLVINCEGVDLNHQEALELTEGTSGRFVKITIADSGVGIPPHILAKIYEPFFTTKEQGKGTGLGLSVVYGVVRSHNGYINVSSEVNSGTAFTMYLPRIFAQESLPEGVQSESLVGGTERVLLIEDESSVGEIGADILQELGYRTDIARNGREAVEKLSLPGARYDLVILDMNMPRMGGRETFDRIKELLPDLKIVVCSGYSASMVDDGKFMHTVDGFIQKPYELQDFAKKIRSVLDFHKNVPA